MPAGCFGAEDALNIKAFACSQPVARDLFIQLVACVSNLRGSHLFSRSLAFMTGRGGGGQKHAGVDCPRCQQAAQYWFISHLYYLILSCIICYYLLVSHIILYYLMLSYTTLNSLVLSYIVFCYRILPYLTSHNLALSCVF